MRILSGIQPSGVLHIGNYFGMMRPAIEMQDEGEALLFIADYHSLTGTPDPASLRELSLGVAIDFLACGIDPGKTVFFRQSDIPQVTELTWILDCVTSMGLLERCHSYKDKIANGFSPSAGLFNYPVLMAADILIYKSTVVPVGRDQKQHVEVARDIAQRFNNRYGEVLVSPEPRIQEAVAVIPGTDGRKMSKSYDNTIEIFGPQKSVRKKIMSLVTDSTPMEEPKDPDACNVFALYKLFGDDDELTAMRANYTGGNYGYGHAKQALFDKFWDYFAPMREKRGDLLKNLDYVDAVLRDGAGRAEAIAEQTMREVRAAVGLR